MSGADEGEHERSVGERGDVKRACALGAEARRGDVVEYVVEVWHDVEATS